MKLIQRTLLACMLVIAAGPAFSQQAQQWKSEGWQTDFSKSSIEFSDILSGGPPRDGIPSIDNPRFAAVGSVKNLSPKDPVIGLEINGDARAYPLSVLMWHEIANDVVGGTPVAVTYCPLCNAAIVFEATVNGKVLSFGTTGKLRNSDLVMYDRATQSWWQQFTGTAIVGDYLNTELKMVPVRLESWQEFANRHPKGKVLVPNNPGMRNYGRNPYVGYDTADKPFLYNGAMPDGINPMTRVVVVRRDENQPIVITMQRIRDTGSMDMEGYRISWKAGRASALGHPQIAKGEDVGSILVEKLTAQGTTLTPYDVTFAFVAHAFHPDVSIIKN